MTMVSVNSSLIREKECWCGAVHQPACVATRDPSGRGRQIDADADVDSPALPYGQLGDGISQYPQQQFTVQAIALDEGNELAQGFRQRLVHQIIHALFIAACDGEFNHSC
jgi:hypothetical protein